MSKSTWTGAVSSDWNDPDNWSPVGVPGASSDVVITGTTAVASASIGTVHSITDSSSLRFRSAGTNTVTTFLDNSGELRVDRKGGAGGTILNIGGTLTNSGSLRIGNATLSASDEVTAASLDNTGEIRLLGSSANQALLDVSGAAGFGTAGVLSGFVRLAGDSAIEFKSGEITSLAANAQLHLRGNDAFIEDSTALGSNSALTGLASLGGAAIFDLENKASVSSTGSLVNDGTLELDPSFGDGGSSLTVGGTLTSFDLLIGNTSLSASDKVTAASLDNTGTIALEGTFLNQNQALLDVSGSAGFGTEGVLNGNVVLYGDSAIEFKSGQINTIAGGSRLVLEGNNAFIEDSTALGSNSALTGLSNIFGSLDLELGVSLSTTGSVTNSGDLGIDADYNFGGSTLSIGGALTNTGSLSMGKSTASGPRSTLTAGALSNSGVISLNGGAFNQLLLDVKSFDNSGTVNLVGNGTSLALNVSGATTNDGAISIVTDAGKLAGAVDGAGSIKLLNANLRFDSSVSAGQKINETGRNALILEEAQSFAATISGFGTGDTIDASNFLLSGKPTFHFVENSANTGGTLTLTDGSLTAKIAMTGRYSNSDFTLVHDSGTGTLVKFV